jgi:hypothetical protein
MHIDQGNMILNLKCSEKEEVTDLQKEIIQFFKDNPNPKDEGKNSIQEWADKNGHDKHEVEEAIYKLVTIFVEFLTNGRANEKGIEEDDVDAEELKLGIEIELEHTTDPETAKRISLDHLAEHKKSDYYTRLKKMEEEMNRELGKNDL